MAIKYIVLLLHALGYTVYYMYLYIETIEYITCTYILRLYNIIHVLV